MTLTKHDLVMRISSETGLDHHQVATVIHKMLDCITEALGNGDKVELRNFGVFEVRIRKGRIGRNPSVPTVDVPIPERAIVKFRMGKKMSDLVLKLTPKLLQPPTS